MTEKEFIDAFMNGVVWSHSTADRALALAKEAGAKFDPEPVVLEPIRVSSKPLNPGIYVGPVRYFGFLVGQDDPLGSPYPEHVALADEMARRCNAWPELRAITEAMLTCGGGAAMLLGFGEQLQALLEGRTS